MIRGQTAKLKDEFRCLSPDCSGIYLFVAILFFRLWLFMLGALRLLCYLGLSVRIRGLRMYTEHMMREAGAKAFWHSWTTSSFVSRTSDLLWKAFQALNRRIPEGRFLAPQWA